MAYLQANQKSDAQRQVIQARGGAAHPVEILPHLVERRQDEIHDPVHEGTVDRGELHDRVREEHDERQDQPLPHYRAQGFIRGVVCAPEMRVAGVLAHLFHFPREDRRRVCLPEEERRADLDHDIEYRRREKDPPPARAFCDVSADYGRDGRPDKSEHAVDGLPFTPFFLLPNVGKHTVADLYSRKKLLLV